MPENLINKHCGCHINIRNFVGKMAFSNGYQNSFKFDEDAVSNFSLTKIHTEMHQLINARYFHNVYSLIFFVLVTCLLTMRLKHSHCCLH